MSAVSLIRIPPLSVAGPDAIDTFKTVVEENHFGNIPHTFDQELLTPGRCYLVDFLSETFCALG